MPHLRIQNLERAKKKETGGRELSCLGQNLSLWGRMVVMKRVLNCSEFRKCFLVLQLGPCWQKDRNWQ